MWAGLSDHIIELVLIKLQDAGGLKAAAVIRLVCKAWAASFSEFTKEAELIVRQGSDEPLDRLCKMMPRLSGVLIRSTSDQLDLSPLGACAHLTSSATTERRRITEVSTMTQPCSTAI